MRVSQPPAPLRGTQTVVGQMGWVKDRPLLTAIEVGWRWIFGIPFLLVCWVQVQHVLAVLPPESTGLNGLDSQNPWVAAVQLARAWTLYRPHAAAVLVWLGPAAALGWVMVSGVGRSLVLRRLDATPGRRLPFRPLSMMVLQAGWLALLGATCWGWFRSMEWVAAAHITAAFSGEVPPSSFWRWDFFRRGHW